MPQENRALAPDPISHKACYGSGQNIEQMGSASYSKTSQGLKPGIILHV